MFKDGLQVEGISNVSSATIKEMAGKKVTAEGSMFVWIPRYAYKMTGVHTASGTISVKFLKGTGNTYMSGTDTELSASTTYPTVTNNEMQDYVVHPAFTYSTAIPGIWVAKFEASSVEGNGNTSTGTNSDNVTTKTLQIKPGVSSWRYIDVNNIYTVCENYKPSMNSHMMKNSEWGAVAYLSQSTHGKGSEIYINNSSAFITGSCGATESDKADNNGGTQNNNYKTGVNASTTGNIYGIYDMSGGSWEYVAAYVANGKESTNGSTLVEKQAAAATAHTVEKYTAASSENYGDGNYELVANKYPTRYGDAIYETSAGSSDATTTDSGKQSWKSDYSVFPYSTSMFFVRGCMYTYTTSAGVFAFSGYTGSAYSYGSFRPVLVVL